MVMEQLQATEALLEVATQQYSQREESGSECTQTWFYCWAENCVRGVGQSAWPSLEAMDINAQGVNQDKVKCVKRALRLAIGVEAPWL